MTPAAWAAGWPLVQAEARAAGRTPDAVTPALYTTLHVDPSPDVARQALRAFVASYYGALYEVIARIQGFHAGDAASCVERLRGFVAAGVRHVVLRFGGGDQSIQLERATRETVPHLRQG